jgi:hypothetical protein
MEVRMKSEEQCVISFRKWLRNGVVGNIIFYHAPNSEEADCIVEQVIKAREMKPEVRAAFEFLLDELGAERGEFFRDKDGKPDRVRVTRRFDVGTD